MLRGALKKNSFYIPQNYYSPLLKRYFSNGLPESPVIAESLSSSVPNLMEKIEKLENSQPFFDRMIFFDPDVMATLPKPLEIFDPIVEQTKVMKTFLKNRLFTSF